MLDIDAVFSEQGLLSESLAGYEMRPQQVDFAREVMKAYKESHVLLAEAATGVGKSWAYLVPALLWAATHRELTVISTHTIALQEQLIHKDIPFLLDLLNLDLEVTLVKGMGNYFCFRKFEEIEGETQEHTSQEKEALNRLEVFSETSSNGCLSDVTFPMPGGLWKKVAAERNSCTHVQCPYFKQCFFFKARRKVSESQILVVNHHLLISEMAMRMRGDFKEEKSILPKSYRIILDEAHHLEEIALESFSIKVDRIDLVRYLGRIYSEFQPQKSRLGLFCADLSKRKPVFSRVLTLLFDVELPAQKREALEKLEAFFAQIETFCNEALSKEKGSEIKERRWRFSSQDAAHSIWKDKVEPLFNEMKEGCEKLFSLLGQLKDEALKDLTEKDKESLSVHISELEFIQAYLEQKLSEMQTFAINHEETSRVRWIEASVFSATKNVTLVDAKLDVSKYLKEHLFETKQTAVLCSATLTAQQNFTFLKQQIGLASPDMGLKTREKVYASPFNFQEKARFLVPSDLPYPHEYGFSEQVLQSVLAIIQKTGGGCFILFTSYEMLSYVYDRLMRLSKKPLLTYMRQGEGSKQALIERFKQVKDGVLFATSSFWEGIDIAGDQLRCVVITKIPFKVPSEPLFQAMSEMYQKQGKDPFQEYSLPLAALRFKQGFGRLIRTNTDRGCVVCLDRRIMTKGYGKVFLKSLPPCPVLYEESSVLWAKMSEFYQKSSLQEV